MNKNKSLNCMALPLIGDMAPKFTATTTNGIIHFPDDYIGHWIVLFAPLNFYLFNLCYLNFKNWIQKLSGFLWGSLPSHLAWFRSIHDEINFKDWKNTNIVFPVIADIDLKVAKLYGMIHPNISDTKTVRAVFIIDPHGIIRTILYYPQTTGRNIKEILRILIALKTTDAFGISTPSDWMPGMPVIEPSPQTSADIQKRINVRNKNTDVQSWYLTFRDLPESKIYDKIIKKKNK